MKKKILIFTSLVVLIMVLVYHLYQDDIEDHGRLYSSKTSMCREFAQSYLKTVQEREPNFNDEKRRMAIDVETDLYNLCLLNLNKQDLGDYKSTVIDKYQK